MRNLTIRVCRARAGLKPAPTCAIDRLDLDEPGEDRELITGLVGDVLLTVCFVQRDHRKRIISARKATYREQNDYNAANSPSQSDDR